jgi:hypothetical protein
MAYIINSSEGVPSRIRPANRKRILRNISPEEEREIELYIAFYKYNNCKEHHEVNTFISKYGLWDLFPIIRALNDHGAYKKGIKGISRKAFAEVCTRLNIKGDNGAPLDRSVHY